MRHTNFAGDVTAHEAKARVEDGAGFVEDAFLHAREGRGDEADLVRRKGGDGDEGHIFGGERDSGIKRGARRGEGDDFDGADHLTCGDGLVRGEDGDGKRFVDEVDRVEAGGGVEEDAIGFCEKIGAACERRGDACLRA